MSDVSEPSCRDWFYSFYPPGSNSIMFSSYRRPRLAGCGPSFLDVVSGEVRRSWSRSGLPLFAVPLELFSNLFHSSPFASPIFCAASAIVAGDLVAPLQPLAFGHSFEIPDLKSLLSLPTVSFFSSCTSSPPPGKHSRTNISPHHHLQQQQNVHRRRRVRLGTPSFMNKKSTAVRNGTGSATCRGPSRTVAYIEHIKRSSGNKTQPVERHNAFNL